MEESLAAETRGVRAEHDSLETYLRSVLTEEQLSRVLIASFSQWEMNSAVVAEIAATLHDMGTSPVVALWADDTPMPDVGWTTSHPLAWLMASPARDQRVKWALRAFGLPVSAFPPPPFTHWRPRGAVSVPAVLNRSSIREMTYRDAALGRAILQVHPDRDTPITDEHLWPRSWVQTSAESFAWAFDQVSAVVEAHEVTAVIVFNGRFLHDSAAAEAASQANLPVLSFDFGGNDTDFDLTIDATHDWSALQSRMLRLYEDWDPSERDELGSSWFEDRRSHADPRNSPFTESQTVGAGIEKPPGKRLVAFFSSSGDEISELDLDWNDYFLGQPGALQAVADVCADLDDTVLLVRTHPHKRHKPRKDVEEWHEAVRRADPDIHLDEHSPIDSYTLMGQADVVITYGSTTGVEAGYARRPVVVMGPSAYDELGCATRVRTIEELRDFLAQPSEGVWDGAVAYGLMMRRRGFSFRYVCREGGRETLAGVELKDSNGIVLKLSNALLRRRTRRLALRAD